MAQSARPQLVSPRAVADPRSGPHGDRRRLRCRCLACHGGTRRRADRRRGPATVRARRPSSIGSRSRRAKTVTGISVIGAKHLANHYGGLKHRIVAIEAKDRRRYSPSQAIRPKRIPMTVRHVNVMPELEDEEDFFPPFARCTDIKTGNSIQIERRETRFEYRRDGGPYRAAELRDHRAVEGLPQRGPLADPARRRDPVESADAQARQDRDDHRLGPRRKARARSSGLRRKTRHRPRPARGRRPDPRSDQRSRRCGARGSASGLRRGRAGARPRNRSGERVPRPLNHSSNSSRPRARPRPGIVAGDGARNPQVRRGAVRRVRSMGEAAPGPAAASISRPDDDRDRAPRFPRMRARLDPRRSDRPYRRTQRQRQVVDRPGHRRGPLRADPRSSPASAARAARGCWSRPAPRARRSSSPGPAERSAPNGRRAR